MAALVCDLCGGKLMMKAGGIAACDSCGMEHDADRMREKVQEIRGVVRIDNTHNVVNFLEMARTAFSAGNNAEAESYCNKTIEIDPKNAEAWFLKGKAAGSDTTFDEPRVAESTTAFIKALTFAPEETRESLAQEARDTILAYVNKYAALQMEIETNSKFYPDVQRELFKFADQCPVPVSALELKQAHVSYVHNRIDKYWKEEVQPLYKIHFKSFDLYKLEDYLGKISFCLLMLEVAAGNEKVACKADVQAYRLSVRMMEEALEQRGWDSELFFYADNFIDKAFQVNKHMKLGYHPEPENSVFYYPKYQLNEESAHKYRQNVRDFESKAKAVEAAILDREAKEREEKARIAKENAERIAAEYWSNRQEEKAALEYELAGITQQLASLQAELASLPVRREISQLESKMKGLYELMDTYSIFKGREKKLTQAQINETAAELQDLKKRLNGEVAELKGRIKPLEIRVSEITQRLTKPEQATA